MPAAIRFIAEHYIEETGEVISTEVIKSELLKKPEELKQLGYTHLEQVELLQSLQDFKISHQSVYISPQIKCPKCDSLTHKKGVKTSKFYAPLTDHEVRIQRIGCKCGWNSPYTIDGIYGSQMHPDLLEKQSLEASDNSYRKASAKLNSESKSKRSVNSTESIRKHAAMVSKIIGDNKLKPAVQTAKAAAAKELVVVADGGHIKSSAVNSRSFEVMIASVFNPANIKTIDAHHRAITKKTAVASSLSDKQATIKTLVLNACHKENMHSKVTKLTCLTDGANNCWSVTNSLKAHCKTLENILDWFHITKRFTIISNGINKDLKENLEKVKWHLWHGNYSAALNKLELLKAETQDQVKTFDLLIELSNYIDKNSQFLVDYQHRKEEGLPFTSTYAEVSVNCLINERQKNNKKMQWSRLGSHGLMQIRTAVFSKSWDAEWKEAQAKIYKKAA